MILLIMGVTGSGKTTVGSLLAEQLGWEFADADNFHSPANKEKMSRGIGLTDADRVPWLNAIHDAMLRWDQSGHNAVLACSALKDAYRKHLSEGVDVRFVYLRGDADFIRERLQHRHGHYATAELVSSQFAALEEPADALVVSIDAMPEQIVHDIRAGLHL
jgi:gluconokinase